MCSFYTICCTCSLTDAPGITGKLPVARARRVSTAAMIEQHPNPVIADRSIQQHGYSRA